MSTTRGRTQRSGKTDVHMWGCLTTIARRWRSPREEDAHFITRSADGQLSVNGGDEGTRTPDPLLAKEVLSQLSYIPTAGRIVAKEGPERGGSVSASVWVRRDV